MEQVMEDMIAAGAVASAHLYPYLAPTVAAAMAGTLNIALVGEAYYKISKAKKESGGRLTARKLKEIIVSLRRPPQRAIEVTVSGTFFEGSLISLGWWESRWKPLQSTKNKKEDEGKKIKWRDPELQQWWYEGFSEWAPSWDVNRLPRRKKGAAKGQPLERSAPESCLFGQIGTKDEADSISVIIQGSEKVDTFLAEVDDRLVVPVVIKGMLCHEKFLKNHLSDDSARGKYESVYESELLPGNNRGRDQDKYHILVCPDREHDHSIHVNNRISVDHYSGYAWNVWAPEEWLKAVEKPAQLSFGSAYFTWQHTNFASSIVTREELASLKARKDELSRRLKDKYQLSGSLVSLAAVTPYDRLPGAEGSEPDPILSREDFLRLLLQLRQS
jgi:hypothetical protein